MRIKVSQSKDDKLVLIKSEGIEAAKKNIEITKQMQVLTLKPKDAYDRAQKTEIARKCFKAAMLMYRDVKGDSTIKYSKATSAGIRDVVIQCYKLSDTLDKMP